MLKQAALLVAITILTSACAGLTAERVVVERTGGELLKLRTGPSLDFGIIVGLPEGTELYQRGCVTEVGQRWCEVALVRSPEVTGYVSADYLGPL